MIDFSSFMFLNHPRNWRNSNSPKSFFSPGKYRGCPEGVYCANFKLEPFSYLNITRISLELVHSDSQCGFACLKSASCFSYNLAAVPDVNGELFCELLPSDKYNNSAKFIPSPSYHHLSISVSKNKLKLILGVVQFLN